jgi:hypothetical protein
MGVRDRHAGGIVRASSKNLLSMADLVLRDGNPEQILLVGDSRIRMFDGLLFVDRARPGREILTRARWRSFFRASTFFGDDGRFDEYMTRLWWELRCVKHAHVGGNPIFTPFRYRRFGDVVDEVALEPSGQSDRTIVVSCGADMWDIEQEVAPFAIRLDAPLEGLDRLPDYDATESIDETQLRAIIDERCAPLYAGMRALRDAGFSKLFLLGCAPSSTEHRDGWKPARLRYAVRSTLDRAYQAFCRQNGIGFVRVWDALAIDGLRDDRYFEDAEHVNLEGATAMLNRIYAVHDASLPI